MGMYYMNKSSPDSTVFTYDVVEHIDPITLVCTQMCVKKMGVIHPTSHSNIQRQFLGTINMAVIAIPMYVQKMGIIHPTSHPNIHRKFLGEL